MGRLIIIEITCNAMLRKGLDFELAFSLALIFSMCFFLLINRFYEAKNDSNNNSDLALKVKTIRLIFQLSVSSSELENISLSDRRSCCC